MWDEEERVFVRSSQWRRRGSYKLFFASVQRRSFHLFIFVERVALSFCLVISFSVSGYLWMTKRCIITKRERSMNANVFYWTKNSIGFILCRSIDWLWNDMFHKYNSFTNTLSASDQVSAYIPGVGHSLCSDILSLLVSSLELRHQGSDE